MNGLEQFNIDDFLAPISNDYPAGVKLGAAEREQLDKLRKEHNPDDYESNDPMHHEPRQIANWPGIIRDAERLLKTTTKDLNLGARLTEAWTKQHGIIGVQAGFTLLRKLCGEAWSRLHPAPEINEADDIETRLRDFRWLDDPESAGMKGARFPSTIRGIVLARKGDLIISADTCRPTGGGVPLVKPADLRAVAASMTPEACEQLAQTVEACLSEVESLLSTVNDNVKADLIRLGVPEDESQRKTNEYLPGFTETRKALEDCKLIAAQMASQRGSDENLPATTQANGHLVPGGSMMVANGGIGREQLYQQLRLVADALEQVEPHSPVPFLIRRAVELRSLKFPQLVEVLTRDARVLDFMRNEIESGDGSAAASHAEASSDS
jgi:type VI secretion system protein ImpA